jgi:uncharacterized protein with HEPN domain
MSPRDWTFRLQDILGAVQKIERYIEGMTYEDFQADSKTVDAVIRQLTIIGEAAGHIPEETTAGAPDVPWRSIRGLRNVVVHEYFGVDMRILWRTVTKNLPALRVQLVELQRRFSPRD